MHTLINPNRSGGFVDADALACPGCHDTVIPEPPTGSGLGAPWGGEFSHRDGSVLCTDGHGQVCEPIEARS